MNGDSRPEGRQSGVGTLRQSTGTSRADDRTSTGSYLRVDGDAERVAADLLEKFGDVFAEQVSVELVELLAPLRRLHRVVVS